MPQLQRGDKKLLRSVRGKEHATRNDHHDPLPTPPGTNSTRSSASHANLKQDEEEDVMRDPESSEDERPTFIPAPNRDGASDDLPQTQFKNLSPANVKSPSSAGSKRSHDSEERASSDTDPIFSSQGIRRKKAKFSLPNIHAPTLPVPHRKKHTTYGKSSQKSSQSTWKPPKKQDKAVKEAEKPTFKKLDVPEAFIFEAGTGAKFRNASTGGDADSGASNSLSPSLSSLSSAPDSPDVEEIQQLDLPAAVPYQAKASCAICGQEVDQSLKECFADRFTDGKALTYKWQQRFCQHHKQHEARETWAEKGYPEIDWHSLKRRLEEHDDYLKEVLFGKVRSTWRDALSKQMKTSRSKTMMQTMNNEGVDKARSSAGYYGPRGEKLMTDHILGSLSDDLRQRASKDKLVAASGVSGGVSGFVQGVLVPELACQLVAEDMRVSSRKAEEIVRESTDLGELLNPDVDERAVDVDDMGD